MRLRQPRWQCWPLATQAQAHSAGARLAADPRRAVFVQTDNIAGNQIVVYDRSADGTLTQAAVYGTGGLGGS